MAIPVLIIGKSGSGKSASLRNLDPNRVALINVLGKPLPFRNKMAQRVTDDYDMITASIAKAIHNNIDIIVIDDAGYLITNMFMRGHSSTGAGNSVYSLYNTIGDCFWNLIESIRNDPSNARVYLMMHEDQNDFGYVKPKTIGKLIDEKICLEGMFTICLRCMISDGKHIFRTQSNGSDVTKSPIGMFDDVEIDNDLNLVDQIIYDYYKEDEKQ